MGHVPIILLGDTVVNVPANVLSICERFQSIIIKVNFAYVAFLLRRALSHYLTLLYNSCLVKMIDKRLNVSISPSKMYTVCGSIIAQIFPKMHGLACKMSVPLHCGSVRRPQC